jgi:hypothetical protein
MNSHNYVEKETWECVKCGRKSHTLEQCVEGKSCWLTENNNDCMNDPMLNVTLVTQ